MSTATFEITVSRLDIYSALVRFAKLCDGNQRWNFIAVTPAGEVYTGSETSARYSREEYDRKMPHPVTVKSAFGNGQCNLPEDWSDDDGDCEDEVDSVVAALADAGYDVTETP